METHIATTGDARTTNHRTPATDPAFITKQELSKRLELTPRTIENLVSRGKLPAIRITSRIIRFKWSDVEAALDTHRVN